MRVFIFLVLFISAMVAIGQTKTFVGLKAGGGANTAYMRHSLLPLVFDVGWLPGANVGVQVTHFSEKFSSRINAGIQLSINYSQKGWIQKFPNTTEPNHSTKINFIEVPLEAVGYFGNKNKYYISAGIFLEYALSDKVDALPLSAVVNEEYPEIYNVGQSHFYRYEIKKDTRLNYGTRGGAGLFRETDIGVFRLEAFFTFSIRSTFDSEPIENGVPDLTLGYGAGITLGYMFSLGKLNLMD